MPNDAPHELHLRYRPRALKDVIGQEEAIANLNDLGKRGQFPHVTLLTGITGTGKTTIARIYARRLKAGARDIHEINCAEDTGIDMVRDIKQRIPLSPLNGDAIVYILDEVHQISSNAQSALLKILEEPPSHVYFFLCTTDPQKLKDTVRGRCHPAKLSALSVGQLTMLIDRVAAAEGMTIADKARDKIIENADGSARNALVLLSLLIGKADGAAQLKALADADMKDAAINLARTLMNKNAGWPAVAAILKALRKNEENAERLRQLVMGYCTSIILGGGKMEARAFVVLDEFAANDFHYSHFPGLVRACYEVVHGGG